jgi:gamma-glutamylaminecyclotransferase
MSKRVNIAVYGTLRQGMGNHRLIQRYPEINYVGTGRTVNKYALRHNKHGIPYVQDKVEHIKPEQLSNVKVEVYSTPEGRPLMALDSLEGHPEWYCRKETPILLENGEEIVAELYFNDDGNGLPINPTGDYFNIDKLETIETLEIDAVE